MFRPGLAGGIGLLALGLAAAASAQSLGDVAKREESRRARVAAPARAYTNADLASDPYAPAAPAPVAPAPAPAADAQPAPSAAAEEPDPMVEADWRHRAAALRRRVEESRAAVAALDKPAEGTAREQERLATLLERARAKLERAENDLRLFEMQADVARVPKTWIR